MGVKQFVGLVVVVVILAVGCMEGQEEERGMCETVVEGTGYTCEEYMVETQDGFLLRLQRISYGAARTHTSAPLPVQLHHVLLHHGLLQGGDN